MDKYSYSWSDGQGSTDTVTYDYGAPAGAGGDASSANVAAQWKFDESSPNDLVDVVSSVAMTRISTPTYEQAESSPYTLISPGVKYNDSGSNQGHKYVGNLTSLDLNAGTDFVIEWWAKYQDGGNLYTVFTTTAGNGGRGYYIYNYDLTDLKLELVFWPETDAYRVFSCDFVPAAEAEPHHYALVGDRTANELYLYKDNVLIGDWDWSGQAALDFKAHGLCVACYPLTGTQPSKIQFDELRFTIGNKTNNSYPGSRQGRPEPSGSPSGQFDHWTAGAYTAALWDAQSLTSGNWTDSVAGITLNQVGSPTYQVSGSGDYSTWKGVTVSSGNRFNKSSASSALDLGASEHAVVQILAKVNTIPASYFRLAGDYKGGSAFWIDPYVMYQDKSAHVYSFKSDSGTSKGVKRERYWMVKTDIVKYRYVFNRTTGLVTAYENGTQISQRTDISSISGHTFTNAAFYIGDASFPVDATIFAVKIDKSTNSDVLNVNDGGPGGG